jgi:integrase/recombinase XerD
MKCAFHSRYSRELQEFVKFRRMYLTSEWPAARLRSFDVFAMQHPRLSLQDTISLWLNREPAPGSRTRYYDLLAIRQFCIYRKRFDPDAYVPDRAGPTAAAQSHVEACILSLKQIKTLLCSVDDLRGSPLRHTRLRTLLLVLYCTGLRIGEAMRLHLSDVDLKRACFTVRNSKGRTRLVPFGRDLAAELRHWLDCRRRAGFVLMSQTALFEREDGLPDNTYNAAMSLNTLFRLCGLKPKKGSGRGGLRVHDLRHNFAVHRLQRFYRAGINPNQMLPWLSAYMGHVNLLGTQRYLKAVPQTLSAASRRFRRSLPFDPARP